MKKWHIVAISTGIMVVAITVCASLILSLVMKPKIVEPVIEKACLMVDNNVIELLKSESRTLREDGVIDDSTFVTFQRAYKEHIRDDEAYVNEIMTAIPDDDQIINEENNSIKTKYASYKVGVEVVKVNESGKNGKADLTYSSVRTSERIKAEDYIEAEKLSTQTKDDSESEVSNFEKLKTVMTNSEFSKLVKVVAEVDASELEAALDGGADIKQLLTESLDEEQYKTLINYVYKYVTIFMDK